MSLTLYCHPLASFCWKVLIALYENDTPFRHEIVDLGDEASRNAFLALWPIGKFPVLKDEARGRLVPESTLIIEYLSRHYPGRTQLLPDDPESAFHVRRLDRFFDQYVNQPMQKIVTDRLRPSGSNDPHGVSEARQLLQTACTLVDTEIAGRTWAVGEAFTMADCSAAPALFYADKVMPLAERWPHATAYLARLRERPAFARTLREAEPYFRLFPT